MNGSQNHRSTSSGPCMAKNRSATHAASTTSFMGSRFFPSLNRPRSSRLKEDPVMMMRASSMKIPPPYQYKMMRLCGS